MSENDIRYVLFSAWKVIEYFHVDCGRAWLDLRPKNIFINHKGQVQKGYDSDSLLQLLFCPISLRSMQQKLTRDSLAYMSPEQVQFCLTPEACPKNEDGEKITSYLLPGDIWSLGVTAVELSRGSPPINVEGLSVDQIRTLCREMVADPLSFDLDIPEDTEESKWSPQFRELVKACLTVNPDDRFVLCLKLFYIIKKCRNEILYHLFWKSDHFS